MSECDLPAGSAVMPGVAMPHHVAIIMDGNGRWAEQRGLPRTEGHRRGVEGVRAIVRHAGEMGLQYLTLFSFSSENWGRPKHEVDALLTLMKLFIQRDLAELHQSGVRVRVIGERGDLPSDILAMIEKAEKLTRDNAGLNLVVAFNYGSKNEIVRATRQIAAQVAEGLISPDQISIDMIAGELDTAGLPDPDLIIRTSGEQRLSNFLLWQGAYSELVFVDDYWPDFSAETLRSAISDFLGRERRFGRLSSRAGQGV